MSRETINKFLTIVLSIAFLFSAISKLIAPGLFEIVILNQGIIQSREVAAYFARLLISFELFLGMALLQSNYIKSIVLPAVLLTLMGFTFLLSFSYLAGNTNNCGCFGDVIKMTPFEAIIKNIILIIIGIFLFLSKKNISKKLYILVTILIISFTFVFTVVPIKSYKDLVFSKYINFENGGFADLTTGNKLVAVFFIDCEHCMDTAKEIVKLEKETSKLQNFYMLFSGEETDSVQHFLEKTNIKHPYLRIPMEDFFDLIGSSPPRIYWLEDGKVKEFWDNNFNANLMRYNISSNK